MGGCGRWKCASDGGSLGGAISTIRGTTVLGVNVNAKKSLSFLFFLMFACSATTSPPAWSAGAASGLAIAVRHDGCYTVTLASRPFLASAVPVEVVSDGVVRRPGAGLAILSTRAFNSSDRVGTFEAFAIEWTSSGVDLTTTFKRHTATPPESPELGTSRPRRL